ncbi:hypothetical protein L6164_018348 [Bauhinia variegata]|uniref:Uncharacterized protein n=1 Tax=Bauhinia variegata TaxID=167791 RepID=A0ACB9NFQ8_BAUVA|nr:hypothetical protein L6164_018348 [Bauhinia variegata]
MVSALDHDTADIRGLPANMLSLNSRLYADNSLISSILQEENVLEEEQVTKLHISTRVMEFRSKELAFRLRHDRRSRPESRPLSLFYRRRIHLRHCYKQVAGAREKEDDAAATTDFGRE